MTGTTALCATPEHEITRWLAAPQVPGRACTRVVHGESKRRARGLPSRCGPLTILEEMSGHSSAAL